MNTFKSKLSLLTTLVCLVFTVEAKVYMNNPFTSQASAGNRLGIGTSSPNGQLHIYQQHGSYQVFPGGVAPSQLILESDVFNNQQGGGYPNEHPVGLHRWGLSAYYGLEFKYKLGSSTTRTVFFLSEAATILESQRFVLRDGNGVSQFEVQDNGYVRARKIKVDLDPIPDYVFEPDYELMSIDDLREYIRTHKHLPNIPSAGDYEQRGAIDLTELNLLLLEKTEEQALYIIELKEDIKAIKKELAKLQEEKE